MPTVDELIAEDERVQRAMALVAQREDEYHREATSYEHLAAARQQLAFEQGRVAAAEDRRLKREREAADKAKQEAKDQREMDEAQAELKMLDAQILVAENLDASILDALDISKKHGKEGVPLVIGVFFDVLMREAGGSDLLSVNTMRYALNQSQGTKLTNVLTVLRARRKKLAASTNGKVETR